VRVDGGARELGETVKRWLPLESASRVEGCGNGAQIVIFE